MKTPKHSLRKIVTFLNNPDEKHHPRTEVDIRSGEVVAPRDVKYKFAFLDPATAKFPWIIKRVVFHNAEGKDEELVRPFPEHADDQLQTSLASPFCGLRTQCSPLRSGGHCDQAPFRLEQASDVVAMLAGKECRRITGQNIRANVAAPSSPDKAERFVMDHRTAKS